MQVLDRTKNVLSSVAYRIQDEENKRMAEVFPGDIGWRVYQYERRWGMGVTIAWTLVSCENGVDLEVAVASARGFVYQEDWSEAAQKASEQDAVDRGFHS